MTPPPQSAVERAVAKERERCAKIVKGLKHQWASGRNRNAKQGCYMMAAVEDIYVNAAKKIEEAIRTARKAERGRR